MLKFYNYDIVFQEIPDEVTLAVNITNCPNRCPHCHSTFLWKDVGEPFNEENASIILKDYREAITCVSIMGGDNDPKEVNRMAEWLKKTYGVKVGWYSGRETLADGIELKNFDYIKIGPYIEALGSLKKRTTNQRLYKILPDGKREDITFRFWKT
jgi:anaerobic ribonucleoside-triphosphate reductase activating protein